MELFRSHGYNLTVKKTAPEYATELVLKYGKNYDMIVCSGGDGTLNEVISSVMRLDKKVTIGYITFGYDQ